MTDKHNTKYNTLISEQPYIHARWSIFAFPGQKWASPGTRDTVGQFRDDTGHSGTVGKPTFSRPAYFNLLSFWSSGSILPRVLKKVSAFATYDLYLFYAIEWLNNENIAYLHKIGLPTVPEWPGSSRNWPTVSRVPGEAHFVPEMWKLTTEHGYMAVH